MSTDSPSTTDRLAEEPALVKFEVWLLGKCSLCGVVPLDHEEWQGGKKWHFHEQPVTDLTDQQALNALVEIAQERCQQTGHKCDWECSLLHRSIVTVTAAVQRSTELASLRERLDTAEGRLAEVEQECDDLAIQRNHLKNRLEDLGVIVDDED